MASLLNFDTHAYIKKLRDAGVSEEQAEIQTEVLIALLDSFLASRRELAEQEISLKRDIKTLDVKQEIRLKELETQIKELETQIKELDVKLETRLKELETGLKELDVKLETRTQELQRDIKELDTKMETRLKELETRLLTRLGSLLFIGIGLLATLMKLL
jgi:DNA repair exonuclease SbcCD ATPase subunit